MDNNNSQLPTPNSRLILIVEDSAVQAEMLRRILVREGYEAVVAKDGAEGLEAARKHKPALIISDINMPVMDGYEMSAKIKQDEALRDIPLILLTQLYEPEEVLAGLESGADAYVTKPYKEDYLLSVVRVTLENPRGFRNNPEQMSVEFDYQGKHYAIHSGRAQTLSFLISSYQNSIMKNIELLRTQEQLARFNEQLDEKVKERTEELSEEIIKVKEAQKEIEFRSFLLDSAIDSIFVIDLKGNLIYANEAAYRTRGYTKEEFFEMSVQQLDTPEYAEMVKSRIESLIETGSAVFESAHVMKNGSVMPVEINASTIEIDGEKMIASVIRDITERKKTEHALIESEKSYRNLVDNAVVGVYKSNLRGEILFANQALAEMYEFESPEEMMSTGALAKYKNPEDRKKLLEGLLKNGRVDNFEADVVTKAGKIKHVLFNATLEGDVLSGMVLDITERKKLDELLREYSTSLEEEVKSRTLQLETANKDLESFSYSVSHDLKAPLRAIDGFSGIIIEDYRDRLDDEGKLLLDVVRDNARKMGRLIDDILAFSRAGRKELEIVKVDMEGLVREVIDEVRPAAAGRNLRFEVKPLSPVMGDRAALRQVFVNLIGNAVKFTRTKEVAMTEIGTIAEGQDTHDAQREHLLHKGQRRGV